MMVGPPTGLYTVLMGTKEMKRNGETRKVEKKSSGKKRMVIIEKGEGKRREK